MRQGRGKETGKNASRQVTTVGNWGSIPLGKETRNSGMYVRIVP